MPKGNHRSTTQRHAYHARRLAWLQAHPELLARLPGTQNDVEPDQSEALDEAWRRMKHERLYAATAATINGRWSIRKLVDELRVQEAAAAT
jgi:hypothetical protein